MANLGINDLLKKAPHVATREKAQAFTEKMKEIAIQEREQATAREAARRGLPYLDLKGFPFIQEVLGAWALDEIEERGAVPLTHAWQKMKIGVLDPDRPALATYLEQVKIKEPDLAIELVLISEESFRMAKESWLHLPHPRPVSIGLEITEQDLKKFQAQVKTMGELAAVATRIPTTEILTLLLAASVRARASDVHFDLEERTVTVRFRIDGVLHEVASLDRTVWPKVLSRIKLLAHLKLNITDTPQDGRFIIHLSSGRLDVRVSTIPTAQGESVTMRLLAGEQERLTFEKLGLVGEPYQALVEEIKKSYGMIIATGPTGAGKTTTLHAILLKLRSPEVNIITIEDPIEYELEGIVQTQVAPKRNYTFAQGLRAILRQDPDIIMVGETRDEETTEVAIQAALTGHLVLSTIHTNTAAGAIPRLLSLGAKPFLLAPSLNAALGQRLVRRICSSCTAPYQPPPELVLRAGKHLASLPPNVKRPKSLAGVSLKKGKGCEVCSGVGFVGRIGIFEVLRKTEAIEKLTLSGSLSEYVLQEQAIRDGMITMIQDGILKALEGITTLEEVFRVAD